MRYSPLGKINFFINSYIRLLVGIFRIPIWFPFLILAFFQVGGLLAFSNFYRAGLSQVLYPALSKLYSPSIFHFPQYFVALPHIFSIYDRFILGPTVGILMAAAAVYKLVGYKRGVRYTFREGLRRAFGSYLSLLLFWIINTGIALMILRVSALAFEGQLARSPRAGFIAGFGFYLIIFIFTAFLLYTVPGIIISGKRFGTAVKDSLKICSSNFLLTYFIVAVPGSIGAAISLFISSFALQIITLFDPGLVAILIYLQIGLGIFVNLFIYGGAVFAYDEIGRG